MKKRYLSFSAFLFCAIGYSQNVTKIEYFLDTDNGPAMNTVVSVTPSEDAAANFTITIPATTASGNHKLYFRAKDANNRWSHTTRMNINIMLPQVSENVVSGEYFLDTDSSFGSAIPFAVSPQGQDILQLIAAQVPVETALGYHKLYGRTKDSYGNWSQTFRKNIEIVESDGLLVIQEIEYFFGSDPEFGNATAFTPATALEDGSWTFNVPYLAGNYNFSDKLYVRAKDANGQWSVTTILDEIELLNVAENSKTDMYVFPNPVSEQLNIAIEATITKLNIYDSSGRNCSISLDANKNTADVSALAPGIYLIFAETSDGILKSKFIKK